LFGYQKEVLEREVFWQIDTLVLILKNSHINATCSQVDYSPAPPFLFPSQGTCVGASSRKKEELEKAKKLDATINKTGDTAVAATEQK
jgi:hypothetical protein